MLPFGNLFPELGSRETRTAQLVDDDPSLPAGKYAFVELYCEEVECDCRRVLIQVRPEKNPDLVMANITFGWESAQFYTAKLGGDAKLGRAVAAASLEPMLEQSQHADWFFQLFRDQVLTDPDYVRRLQRHYRMFKEAVKKSAGGITKEEARANVLRQWRPSETRTRYQHPGRNPDFERLDDLMQQGYREWESRRGRAACEVWIGAANLFFSLYRRRDYAGLEAFDEAFAGTEFVYNWVHDLMESLHSAGLAEPIYHEHRVRLAADFLQQIGVPDRPMREFLRQELAIGWSELRRRDQSDALFTAWLREDPKWGWGWIVWADMYHYCRGGDRDLARAEELLERGLAVKDVRDRDALIDRQADLRERQGRMEEAKALRQTANALRASAARQRMPAPFRASSKSGRNDPCPCGSGKKHKKCCGR